ncbi:MAG: DUF2628 domain-containing protein [Rickettsiaceae bacterium H1]|nr:DUF2628 domain-containing protein [Rickettsiaceae bacterium H1]
MKQFLVFVPQDNNLEKTVFVKDGFSFRALVFTILWTLYNRLYFMSFLLFLTILLTELLFQSGYISEYSLVTINMIGCPLLCGLNGNYWLHNSLLKSNYEFAGIIVAHDLTEAQMRFFSEYDLTVNESKIDAAW